MSAMTKHLAATGLFAALTVSAMTGFAAETLTYSDLVKRYTDLERLAVQPDGSEQAGMWSSYDRRSRYDETTNSYVDWDANLDGDGYIRMEGENIVMAEMEGPGCIWRFWAACIAHLGQGHVKIYLDGADKPVVDLPFSDYFKGTVPPFNYKSLTYNASDGLNLYFPIPYQKSCRIVAEPKWGKYFHFNFTTFSKDTKVPTFSTELSAEDAKALDELDEFFSMRIGEDPKGRKAGEKTVSKAVEVKPGESVVLADIKGPRAITAMRFKMAFGGRESEMAPLRELALKITWDGQESPAVHSPLGDFFGTAPGVNKFKSLPLGITEDGFYCYWYMPFESSALVQLVNDGTDRSYRVEYSITHAPLAREFKGLGHFHAKWHRDITPPPEDRKVDWTILKATGRGRFVGMMLHVWSPYGGWWGEGDEKFFVDGEKFPSVFGTGSEDYFGYAWGNPSPFNKPFHGQTMTMKNAGHQSLYRWQIADDVPFTKSFDGYIEKWVAGGNFGARKNWWACTAYWYLSPDGDDPIALDPVSERMGYFSWPPENVAGFRLQEFPARGLVRPQDMSAQPQGKWAGDEQLLWTGGAIGDSITILTDAEKTGRYQLDVLLTKSWGYGIVEVYLDDKKVSGEIDLYSKQIVNTGPIDLGTHELEKGQHKVTFKIVGVNEEAEKAHPNCRFVGIDDIRLTPQK